MSSAIAPNGRIYDAISSRSQLTDGRMGSNPALATMEHGERIFNATVNDTVIDVKRLDSMA